MSKIIEKINHFCFYLESRFGVIFAGVILGLIIIGFDMLYITPKFVATYHGLSYSNLSNNSFDFSYSNPLRYRILPSLIGYITFLRGDWFFIVPLIFTVIFSSSIYIVYRKKNYSPIDSLLFTGLLAFSCTVYIQLVAPGYTDVIFYFFIFISFSFIEKIYLSALFFSLALLSHESSIFLLPGLLLYSNYINKGDKFKFLQCLVVLIIATFPLLLYRKWVSNHINVEYNLNFYFSTKNIVFSVKNALALLPAGAFYAFKLFWFFPIYILYKTWKRRELSFFMLLRQ
jgi:hypothetical protein